MMEEKDHSLDSNTENDTGINPEGQMSINDPKSDALSVCEQEKNAWKDKFLRVQADLENANRRMEKERLQWRSLAQTALLLDILPIVDDFDRAFQTPVPTEALEIKTWFAGFEMIRKSFGKLLEKYEVKEIPETMPFDPIYHEAIVQVEAPNKTSGEIVAILQKGYTCKGAVLRPAKVSVAK